MTETSESRIWPSLGLVLLAGAILALAWWEWTYPSQLSAWWNGQRIYHFYRNQLIWLLVALEVVSLSLWLLSALALRQGRPGFARAAWPFALVFPSLFFFARYNFHPLGVQPGSSIWTLGLVAVTAGTVAVPLARIVGATGLAAALRRRGLWVVSALAVVYALVFGFLSVARHLTFRSHALDLGTMDQAAWNTIHGRILERTPLYRSPAEGSPYESRLLDAKLELILLPLSALYWLWADPCALLIVQTLSLAAGAIPLYLLISRGAMAQHAESALLGTVVASAYLLYMPLHFVNMSDFHTSALMVPLLIAAWGALRARRWHWYYVWLVLALSCRIDAAFTALALGAVIAAWHQGDRRHGLYTMAMAAAWLVVDFGIVVPWVRQGYGPGAGDLVARRFGELGGDASSVIQTALTRPGALLTRLAKRDNLQVVFDLLAPTGYLPLSYPLALLPALPVLAINLLADSMWQGSIHAHYMAAVIPFLWIAVAEGLNWLMGRARFFGARPAGLLSLAILAWFSAALNAHLSSPFPPGKAFRLAEFYQPSSHVEDMRQVVALIPDGASVCAQSDVYPHVSQRRDALLFYYCALNGEEWAEYVVLDLDAESTKSPLGYHAFYKMVDIWVMRADYGVVARRGGVLLLRRGASREGISEVLAALHEYGLAFYRVDFVGARLPREIKPNEVYRVPVTVRNIGSQGWHSMSQLPVRLAYRWWTENGALLAVDALRTNLPRRVEPGDTIRLQAWLKTPPNPGQYTLEWDMLREGDAWFGDMGAEMLHQEVEIR